MSEVVPEDRIRGTLGALLPLKYGKSLPAAARDATGSVPVFGSSGIVGQHSAALTNGPTIIVGRKGNVGAVHFSAVPCWPIDTAYFVEPPAGHSAAYYRYLLTSLNLVRLDKSTAIPGLSRDDYNAVEVAVHAPAQQLEIVAELEKQFSRLDEAVANLQRVKANLKRYEASVLKAAVEGRLVETEATLARREGRTYEAGEQLLQRILEERRAKWAGRGKYKEPESPRIAHMFDLPEGWTWATLGHLCLSVKDGPHYSPKYADDGIPFISGGNVRPEGIDFTSTKYITNELHQELSKRCKPQVGDLLYTKGGTTGIARVNTYPREFNVWVHVAVLKLAKPLEPFYVQHALNSQHCYRQAQEYTHGVGNQDLGLTRMVWITVPLPPQAEQARIVAEVDRHLSIIREVESEIDRNLKRSDATRQSILANAFGVAISANEINSGSQIMKTRKLPSLPASRKSDAEDHRLDLIKVLQLHPDGLNVEQLFQDAGYRGDQVDDFYRDLALISDRLLQFLPASDGKDWPASGAVTIQLKA